MIVVKEPFFARPPDKVYLGSVKRDNNDKVDLYFFQNGYESSSSRIWTARGVMSGDSTLYEECYEIDYIMYFVEKHKTYILPEEIVMGFSLARNQGLIG